MSEHMCTARPLSHLKIVSADRPILPPGIYYPPGIGEERTWEAQYEEIVYDAWSKSYICEADHKLVDGGKFCNTCAFSTPSSRGAQIDHWQKCVPCRAIF
jgi:hypothetical protein